MKGGVVILTTGGTGVTGRDGTPEAVRVLFDKEIEGFGETFRVLSYQQISTSTIQSRAIAGVASRVVARKAMQVRLSIITPVQY